MANFPTFTNGIRSQLPYGEEDDFSTYEGYLPSGFVTAKSLNPSGIGQKVFSVNLPRITQFELSTFESFFASMGQVGTFSFVDDAGTFYPKCRFDSGKYTVTYVGPGEYSVDCTIRSLVTGTGAGTGPGGSVTLPLSQQVTAATLTIISQRTIGGSTTSSGNIYSLAFARTPGSGTLGTNNVLHPSTNGAPAWATATDTWALPNPGGAALPSTGSYSYTAGFQVEIGIDIISGFAANQVDELFIYDVTLSVTYADSSTATLRPVSAVATGSNNGTDGTLSNPGNAIDTSTSTYALIHSDTTSGHGGGAPNLLVTF